MDHPDGLLLLLGLAPDPSTQPEPLDPVRIMKGVFLLTRKRPEEWSEAYHFIPYNYGPVSFEVYDDLAALVRDGLVRTIPVPGYSWRKYELTERGRKRCAAIVDHIPAADLSAIRRIRRYVGDRSFLKLLRDIYRHYPEFAANSVLA